MLTVKKEYFNSIRALVDFMNDNRLNKKHYLQTVQAIDEPGYFLIYQTLEKEDEQ